MQRLFDWACGLGRRSSVPARCPPSPLASPSPWREAGPNRATDCPCSLEAEGILRLERCRRSAPIGPVLVRSSRSLVRSCAPSRARHRDDHRRRRRGCHVGPALPTRLQFAVNLSDNGRCRQQVNRGQIGNRCPVGFGIRILPQSCWADPASARSPCGQVLPQIAAEVGR